MTQAIQRSLHTFSRCVHRLVFGVIWGVFMFGIGLNQNAYAATSDTIDGFSAFQEARDNSLNDMMQESLQETLSVSGEQEQVTFNPTPLNKNIDWSNVVEKEILKGVSLYSEQDLKSLYFEPMPRVKRPSLNAQKLSPEERNFCLVFKAQHVEDVSNVNPQCLDMSNYIQEFNSWFKKYSTLLALLNAFRERFELGLTEEEFREIVDFKKSYTDAEKYLTKLYNMPVKPEGSVLTHEETEICTEILDLQDMFIEGIKVGYPVDRVNKVNSAYNQKCKGRIILTREFMQRTVNVNKSQKVMPVIAEVLYRASESVHPKTFLFPFEGTDEQRTPEILEAQKYLNQLGYLKNQPTGKVDLPTVNAISEFERDLGLIQTGELSFTNMMRLRLFTVGYHATDLL